MTIQERVATYFAKNDPKTIYEEDLPKIAIYWHAKGGMTYFLSDKKERTTDRPWLSEGYTLVSTSSNTGFIYFHYNEEFNAMECRHMAIRGKRYVNGADLDVYEYYWYPVVVAFDGIPTFYDVNGKELREIRFRAQDRMDGISDKYRYEYMGEILRTSGTAEGAINRMNNKKNFDKFTNNWTAVTKTGIEIAFENPKFMEIWIASGGKRIEIPKKEKSVKRKGSKLTNQEIVDMLSECEIPEETIPDNKSKFYKLNEQWGVIKFGKEHTETYNRCNTYISSLGRVVYGIKRSNEDTGNSNYFVVLAPRLNTGNHPIINEEDLKSFIKYKTKINNALAYAKEKKVGTEEVLYVMWNNPLYEKFISSPYKNLLFGKKYIYGRSINVGSIGMIKKAFGNEINQKTGSLFEACGMNKEQLDFVDAKIKEAQNSNPHYYYYYYDTPANTISGTKKFFNQFDLRNIPTSKFKLVYDFVFVAEYVLRDKAEFFKAATRNENPSVEEKINVIKRFNKMSEDNEKQFNEELLKNNLAHARDIMRMDPNTDISEISRAQDLKRVHDQVVDEYNRTHYNWRYSYNSEVSQETFEKNKAKRDCYNFEDENYMIINPRSTSEIRNEGNSLGHCVGSYANNHGEGMTNIFFLRKKGAPDTSWFTIEMNNNKNIVQIHGKRNSWLGSSDDSFAAVPFLKKWFAKNSIHCADNILLSTSQSYSMGSNFRKMPD